VVIDAGHGGHDPGTAHYGLKEKALALDIARRLRTHLQGAGLTVVMTRETDRFIPLSSRPAVANRLSADLFVSVHINANHNRRVSGIEVYYPRESVVSAAAPWPPSITSSELGTPSTSVKQILWDLVLRRTRFQSRRLASSICRSMRDGLAAPCRATKPARFVVLREARMPAVLVEVGYVTNRDEAVRLGNSAYRQAAAQAIAQGIVSYIRDVGAQHI
jgi:N-acetylmuramoyl-L-alanine amidase